MKSTIHTFLNELGFPQQTCPDGIESSYMAIDEDHVISRDKDGNVVSRFRDLRWNFSYYASRELKIGFNKIYETDTSQGKVVYNDLKICCLYLLYFPRFNSIRAVISAAEQLFFFADYAVEKRISFRQALCDISPLSAIVNNKNLSNSEKYRKLANILSSYNRLGKLSAIFPSFNFSPDKESYGFALKHAKFFKKDRVVNQTPVIPTRLLSEVISECSRTLSSIFYETTMIENGKRLLLYEVIEKLLDNTIDICTDAASRTSATCIESPSSKTIHSMHHQLYFSAFQISCWNALKPFCISDYDELKLFFSYCFSCGRTLTQIFTGMRFEESSNVPYNGFEQVSLEGEDVYLIRSWTTKLEVESARFAKWFTSELYVSFNKSIQTLVKIFYLKYKGIDIDVLDQSMYPLFPAISGKTQVNPFFHYPSFRKFLNRSGWSPHIKFTPQMTRFLITEEDMLELKKQASWRNWLREGYSIGEEFPFTSHKFRRSLVVYAARSGLVSLPSLQSNLQHLTQTMTAYYAAGASYADNFILEGRNDSFQMKSLKSFVNEFRDEQLDVEVDAIWDQVVYTDDVLFGSFGSFLQRKKEAGELPTIFESRESIQKAVKKGRLAYKKTPLGGCCALTPCDKATFTSITACVLCENAVFNKLSATKLEKTLNDMRVKLSQFHSESPFAIQINREITAIESVLLSYRKTIEGRNNDAGI
ncbi:hypothetical protein [Aeromonas jandaei]|uniref:hypothetical protein n=1 Tax=Aeromonas jandaei TaxID=650 RepID=UPI0038B474DE